MCGYTDPVSSECFELKKVNMVKDQLCNQICKGSDLFVPAAAEHTAAAFFKTQELSNFLSTKRTPAF